MPRALQALVCTRHLALDRGRLFYSCRPAAIRCINVRQQAQAAAHASQATAGAHSLERQQPASSAAASSVEDGLAAGFSKPASLPSHVGIAAPSVGGLPGGGADASVDEALIVVGDGNRDDGGTDAQGPVPPVRHLLCENTTLLFALRDRLYAYSRTSGTVTATFRHFEAQQQATAGGSASKAAGAAAAAPREEREGLARRGSKRGDKVQQHICGVSAAGDTILVQYPRVVYVMDRLSLERTPLRVLQVVHLPCTTLDVADFGPHLLTLAHPSVEMPDGLGEPPTQQSIYVMERHPAGTPKAVVRQVLHLPSRAGPAVALAPGFALQSDESDGYSAFANTHVFIAAASALLVVRAARPSEQVALLAKHGHFATAQHLVQQRHKQPRVLVEVSNVYACQLWHQVGEGGGCKRQG